MSLITIMQTFSISAHNLTSISIALNRIYAKCKDEYQTKDVHLKIILKSSCNRKRKNITHMFKCHYQEKKQNLFQIVTT